jgi:hypothetical protein
MDEGFAAQSPAVPVAVAELDAAMDSDHYVRLSAPNIENGDRFPEPTSAKTPQFSISNEQYEQTGQNYHARQQACHCIFGAIFAVVFVVFLGVIISNIRNINSGQSSSYWAVGTGGRSSYPGYGTYSGFSTDYDDMY